MTKNLESVIDSIYKSLISQLKAGKALCQDIYTINDIVIELLPKNITKNYSDIMKRQLVEIIKILETSTVNDVTETANTIISLYGIIDSLDNN